MSSYQNKETDLILVNTFKNNLPHIYIPEINANFLIDTGSTKSLIDPSLAYKFYRNYIFNENFNIQTAHNTSFHNEVAEIPIFQIFKINQKHKFYLFKFSDKYDGLIGVDLLNQLNANINVKNKQLTTPVTIVPIIFEPNPKSKMTQANDKFNLKIKNFSLEIEPRVQKIVKIPVKQKNGLGILNFCNFGNGLEMPKAVVNVFNYYALTSITNISDRSAKLIINEPFDIEPLDSIDTNFIEKMEIDDPLTINHDNYLKENLKNLRLDHCNKEEKDAIRKLCFEYRDIFYCDNIPLSFTNKINHKIRTKDDTPIFTKSYRFPEVHRAEVKDEISKMLEQDIIQPSISPWSSPIWVVPKKLDASGKKKWRLVIDYRNLNMRTIDEKYPLPNITDILDKLGKANYFTTLDLASGFHQILVDPEDIEKTAFSTEGGHYEFKRMPFGLKNAPATFQRVMDNVLRGLQNEICSVYLDDIIIFSTSLDEHLVRIKSVFDRLRESNFKIQLDKSEFFKKSVQYLGHIITQEGVKPNPDKISIIKNFPIPRTQKDIKSFLGLLGYYRKFIRDFAKLTKPMTMCLKKGASIKHDEEFIKSFNTAKEILTNDPILQFPDFSKEFVLTTDASNVAIGAVLSQGTIPHDKPVAYASRTLNDTETKYSTVEKELLAIVWACKHFRPYLYGRKFTIYTDHRPLIWLFNLREPNSKLVRWRLKLEEYDYKIVYKKGKFNTNADCLSRVVVNAIENESIINNPGDIDYDISQYLGGFSDLSNFDDVETSIDPNLTLDPELILKDIELEPKPNKKINIISDILISGPRTQSSTQHSNSNGYTNDGITILEEMINNKINQILVYPNVYPKIIVNREKYENHNILKIKIPEINNEKFITDFLKEYTDSKTIYNIYFHKENLYRDFCNVYLKHFSASGPKLVRCTKLVNTVQDEEEQLLMIKNHHEGKTNHRGISETLEYLKQNYYWKNMKISVTNYINQCDICNRSKYGRKKPYVPLMVTETPSKPFQVIHIDIFTFDNRDYLTIVDAFSKFAQAILLPGKTAVHTCKGLIKYFSTFGVPENITVDNGSNFNCEIVKELLKLHKIKVHFTTPWHHESNAIVERFHSTIIEHLRILREMYPNEANSDLMDYAIIGYNSSIHSSTNFTPFELTFGHTNSRNPEEIFYSKSFFSEYVQSHRDKLKHIYGNVAEKLRTQKENVILKRNTMGDQNEFKLGKTVYKINPNTRNKKNKKYLGPYVIIEILDRNRVKIANKSKINKIEVIHIKELKKPSIVTDSPSASEQQN